MKRVSGVQSVLARKCSRRTVNERSSFTACGARVFYLHASALSLSITATLSPSHWPYSSESQRTLVHGGTAVSMEVWACVAAWLDADDYEQLFQCSGTDRERADQGGANQSGVRKVFFFSKTLPFLKGTTVPLLAFTMQWRAALRCVVLDSRILCSVDIPWRLGTRTHAKHQLQSLHAV